MDWQLRGRPPLIPSQLSAKLSAEQWSQANSHDIIDYDGLHWQVHISRRQIPALNTTNQLLWEFQLQLRTSVNTTTLLATGTLDPQEDERLVELLGESQVDFALRPRTVQAAEEDKAAKLANRELASYVATIQQASLGSIKKQLIGRFINEQKQFRELG